MIFAYVLFISETLLVIVAGVGLLAFVGTIMVVNWARLIFDKKVAKTVVSSVLIFFNSLGLIGVLYLGCSHFFNCSCNTHTDSKSDETDDSSPREFTFFKIELMSLYLFGLCYLFHCGLYAWKHSGNDMLAFTYNIITIVYVFF